MPLDDVFQGPGQMRAIMRSFDWSSTPLGPPDNWPQSLRTTLRTMLASRYAMWMGWGPDLTFLYNDTYGRVTLGKKHPWALGKPTREVWSEIWTDLEPRIQKVFSTGEATWDEALMLFLERSGFREETYHTFSYSPLANDDGSLAGLFCVVTEETERILGERQLSSLRDLAATLTRVKTESTIFHAIDESLARSDRDLPFTITYTINEERTAAILASCTGAPSIHRSVAPPLIELGNGAPVWPIDRVLREGSLITIDLAGFHADALPSGAWAESPTHAVALPIASRGGDAPTGVLIAGLNRYRKFDETYRGFLDLVAGQIAAGLGNVRAYEQERRRAEALAELDRAKTAFFSNVSHELRTPLTLMLGPLEDELTAAKRTGAETANLQLIERNGLRLLKLVNTLLEFSRVEAGRIEARFRPVDLSALTASLASTFRSAIERAGLCFNVEAEPHSEPVYIDPEMWEKIVLNLISNAFKSTFEGSITIRVSQERGEAVLEVTDTGTGIPAEDVPHLFERFHRVENARRRTHEGSGIGLALVNELVRMHGGSISVETEAGKGTTFRVHLPLGAAHLPSDRVQPPAETNHAANSAYVIEAESWLPRDLLTNDDTWASTELPASAPAAEDASVLVVDDNSDMRDYVSSLLGRRFRVRTAHNGKTALDSILESPPDLVLSDVMMPELDGFGLLSAIRANERLRDIPVILLSARAGEESRVEGMEAGADDYLVKPFTARELIARVSAHIGMARLRREAAARERELLAQTEAERNRLRNLFDQAPAAICVLSGPEHRFTLANSLYLQLIGIENASDVLGRSLLEVLPELRTQGFNELLDGVFQTGIPYIGREHPVTLVRGENGAPGTVFLNFVYQPWRAVDGTIEGVFVHAIDVTESVQARRLVEELALSVHKNEARLQAILRQVVSGVCQINSEGEFEFYNDRLCEISGRSRDQLSNVNYFDLAGPEQRAETFARIGTLFLDGKVAELVQCWRRPDGTAVWVQQNLSGVVDERGRVESIVCVVQDITAKKQAEEALHRNDKLAAVGQLASTIAHEINNPLEAVTNLLYLIHGSDSLDESRTYAATASSELLRVSHVVTSTLHFHRKPLELTPAHISSIVESAVALYDGRIRSSEIEISTCFRDPAPILCLEAELRQVFANIVGNAFDATRNAPVRKIFLRVRPGRSPRDNRRGIRVTIADTGQGMDESTRKRIFDPFFTTKGISGSGLGLWLSLEILRKHHALLGFRSAIGKGTIFSIFIPEQSQSAILETRPLLTTQLQ